MKVLSKFVKEILYKYVEIIFGIKKSRKMLEKLWNIFRTNFKEILEKLFMENSYYFW